jgi:acetolactate synthase-1/2/3 large subunit
MATSGPGALNLVTALADAQADSVPVLAITGQVPRHAIGTDAFQEADIIGITTPVTKHNTLVTDPADLVTALAEAFHIATTGRPGAVLVDIPKDVLQSTVDFSWPPVVALPGYQVVTEHHDRAVAEAARLIGTAQAPVLYVGGGVIKAQACVELRDLAELTGIPLVTTLMARGAFPDGHDLHLGMPGMHGAVAAVAAMQRSDLLIALGARFDDRVTGLKSSFAPNARIIQVDIDSAEIGKNRAVDVGIEGDCRAVIAALTETLAPVYARSDRPDLRAWRAELEGYRTTFPLSYDRPGDGTLAPQMVIEAIGNAVGPEAIYVSGVGQHQMWAAQYLRFTQPRTWLNSGGIGTMGYAIPAALGAKLGLPDREVWVIDGDGCFQMTYQELATAAIEGVPIKVAVINNGNLGMVKQLQAVHYESRYSAIDLATHSQRIPDFVKLGEALGCAALRCECEADVAATIATARAINDRPVVIDFVVNNNEMVWPMVAAGTSNDHIMAARGVRPFFDNMD